MLGHISRRLLGSAARLLPAAHPPPARGAEYALWAAQACTQHAATDQCASTSKPSQWTPPVRLMAGALAAGTSVADGRWVCCVQHATSDLFPRSPTRARRSQVSAVAPGSIGTPSRSASINPPHQSQPYTSAPSAQPLTPHSPRKDPQQHQPHPVQLHQRQLTQRSMKRHRRRRHKVPRPQLSPKSARVPSRAQLARLRQWSRSSLWTLLWHGDHQGNVGCTHNVFADRSRRQRIFICRKYMSNIAVYRTSVVHEEGLARVRLVFVTVRVRSPILVACRLSRFNREVLQREMELKLGPLGLKRPPRLYAVDLVISCKDDT